MLDNQIVRFEALTGYLKRRRVPSGCRWLTRLIETDTGLSLATNEHPTYDEAYDWLAKEAGRQLKARREIRDAN